MVRTQGFDFRVQSLVRVLRSCKLHGTVNKTIKIKEFHLCIDSFTE